MSQLNNHDQPDQDRGADGRIYNPITLRLYDVVVLGLTNTWIWRCPTASMKQMYRDNMGARHLDIGPGTGYYLQDSTASEIVLLDRNTSSLHASARRIEQSTPAVTVEQRTQSFFDPIEGQFDSIGANFLLHCIPGSGKWERLAELANNLKPGGVLFGSTVVLDPQTASPVAQKLNAFYNRVGVFGNSEDSSAQLKAALQDFAEVEVQRHGQVLVFIAKTAQ